MQFGVRKNRGRSDNLDYDNDNDNDAHSKIGLLNLLVNRS